MRSSLIPIISVAAMIAIPADAQVSVDFFGGDRRDTGIERIDNFADGEFRFGPDARQGVGIERLEDVPDREIRIGRIDVQDTVPSLSTDPSLPIFFDAFFADNGGVPADNFNAFVHWTVSAGSVDLAGEPVLDPFGNPVVGFDERGGPLFGRFVDLGGSTGTPGVLATRFSFPFVAGATYNLSFDFNSIDGNPNTATITIGSFVFTVSSSSRAFTRFSQNFSFATTTIAALAFQSQGSGGVGIDNVILTSRQ
ncbi:MAG: hypothetical protein ACREV9_03785 [Burkholderiales bacterium]